MIGLSRAGCAALVGLAATLTLGAVVPGHAAVGDGPRPADQPEDVIGAWTGPFGEEGTSPAPFQAAVIGDGRVLYLTGNEGREDTASPTLTVTGPTAGQGWARLLDLRSGTPQFVPTAPAQPAADLWGPSLTTLADGRILLVGETASRLFDPATSSFSPPAALRHRRHHPQVAVGADGRPTAFGGAPASPGEGRLTETYDPERNRWEENDTGPESANELPPEPRIVLAPDGRFLYAAAGRMGGPGGPAPNGPTTALFQFFDPGTKTWKVAGAAPLGARSGAFVTPLTLKPPYDRMTVVTFGGALGPAPALPAGPLTTLTAVDADGEISNRDSGPLHHARWHSSGVLLPDGKVLAVGGSDRDDARAPGLGRPVRVPELYDPSTGVWAEMAPHRQGRGYHHSALLLADMRVLVGGADPGFEVWSPPYLFRGPRPSVTRVQRGVGYRETFDIATPDAGLIESVVLLRTPSPEQANDSDQRAVELEFSRRGPGVVTATAPPSGAVAPPGPYYLVVNKRSLRGPVPSVARMVDVGRTDRGDAPRPYPDDPPAPAPPGSRR